MEWEVISIWWSIFNTKNFPKNLNNNKNELLIACVNVCTESTQPIFGSNANITNNNYPTILFDKAHRPHKYILLNIYQCSVCFNAAAAVNNRASGKQECYIVYEHGHSFNKCVIDCKNAMLGIADFKFQKSMHLYQIYMMVRCTKSKPVVNIGAQTAKYGFCVCVLTWWRWNKALHFGWVFGLVTLLFFSCFWSFDEWIHSYLILGEGFKSSRSHFHYLTEEDKNHNS